jgi:cAMP-binding proteins - catabolite gene activator and regulatory subunit of cAMP-dependent protein kinases
MAGGTADVFVHDGRAEKRVNTLKDGDYFGEFALLTEQPRTATVRAAIPVEVYSLSREDFRALLEQEPSLQEIRDRFIAEREAQFAAAAAAVGLSPQDTDQA